MSEEIRYCIEVLLDRPIITALDDRHLLDLIRRHAPVLQDWFGHRTGWRLQEHPEFVRLLKTPARVEPAHRLTWIKDSQDYELLAWVLWYGEHTGGRKFTLSQFTEAIRTRTQEADEAATLDWSTRDQRLAVKRVFLGLEALGVLRLQDGSVDEWIEEFGKREALYDWGTVAWRLHVDLAERDLERLAAGESTDVPLTAPPGEGAAELRLYRALLLNSALFRADDAEAFALLQDPEKQLRIARDLADTTGWQLEVTTSYARLLRTPRADESVQTPIPVYAGLSHVVLFVCAALRDLHLRGQLIALEDDCFLVHESRLEQEVGRIQEMHGENWGKGLSTASVRTLTREVLDEMRLWGLLRGPDSQGQYVVLPTAARLSAHYAGDAEEEPEEAY